MDDAGAAEAVGGTPQRWFRAAVDDTLSQGDMLPAAAAAAAAADATTNHFHKYSQGIQNG